MGELLVNDVLIVLLFTENQRIVNTVTFLQPSKVQDVLRVQNLKKNTEHLLFVSSVKSSVLFLEAKRQDQRLVEKYFACSALCTSRNISERERRRKAAAVSDIIIIITTTTITKSKENQSPTITRQSMK